MGLSQQDIFNLFIEESVENLDKMEHALVNMHTHGISEEATAELFRYVHTLKGSAANFRCTGIAKCAHILEEVLDQFRITPGLFRREYVPLFFESADVFRAEIGNLSFNDIKEKGGRVCGEALQQKLKLLLVGSEDEPDELSTRQWMLAIRLHDTTDADAIAKLPKVLRQFMALGDTTIDCMPSRLEDIEHLVVSDLVLMWELEINKSVLKSNIQKVITKYEKQYNFELSQRKLETQEGLKLAEAPSSGGLKSTDITPSSGSTASASPAGQPNDVLRVSMAKIDLLSGAIGELLAKQADLEALLTSEAQSVEQKSTYSKSTVTQTFDTLRRSTMELQSSIMTLRMLKMDLCFDRFQRLCAELSISQGKLVQLETIGGDTEIDKFVFESIVESLMHLIRNSVDHGMELPEERKKEGKLEQGTIQLTASQKGGYVVIEVRDDGRGIDYGRLAEKYNNMNGVAAGTEQSIKTLNQFIFESGVSTRTTASEVSGRGVGMDVVKQNIEQLDGNIQIGSVEVGSCFILKVPLTLAVLEGQLVCFRGDQYVIPISYIIETIRLDYSKVTLVCPGKAVYSFRGESIPIVPLVGNEIPPQDGVKQSLIIVSVSDQLYGVVVEEVLGNQQITMKSLDENFILVPGFSGATVLTNGKAIFVVDVAHQVRVSEFGVEFSTDSFFLPSSPENVRQTK